MMVASWSFQPLRTNSPKLYHHKVTFTLLKLHQLLLMTVGRVSDVLRRIEENITINDVVKTW